jgi:predicted porin
MSKVATWMLTGAVGMGVAASAAAQSSVTLYGSLDAGVAYVSNVGGSTKYAAENGNTQPDRWGLLGTEDLGGGWSALFRLENGFSTITGAMASSGTLFNRNAYVGLSDAQVGTLTLGHQTPFTFDVLGPLSTAYLGQSWYAFHPGNLDQLADTSVVPYNNSVKFRSTSFNGFQFGAMYGFGNTTDFSYGSNLGFEVNYKNGPLQAAATWANQHNGTASLATIGFTGQFQGQPAATYAPDKQENMGAGLSYKIGSVLLHGLYTRVKFQSAGQSATYQSTDVGANWQASVANVIGGGVANTTFAGRRWTQFELGDTYSLSKSTQVYANVLYEQGNSLTQAALYTAGVASGRNQLAVVAGVHHSF